jgi:tripartite-type tricarboxylate transporter receptor subunit TctC
MMGNRQLGIALRGFMLVVLVSFTHQTLAQEKYPARPIEIIVPTPPGGGTDLVIRQLAEIVEPLLGQKVVVVNRPGGGGMLGMAAVVKAKPDGYVLGGLWNAPLTMTPHMQKAPYGPNDYLTISMADTSPVVLCVKKDFPAQDSKEFFAHLKSHPGKYTYGTDGVGGTIQLASERVFIKLGLKVRAVPFGGAGETVKNYLGGHVDFFGGSITTILPYVKEGSTRCMFSTGSDRVNSLPDVANLTDLGMPEASTQLWHGVVAPKGLAPDRVAILEKAFQQAAQSDKFKQFMEPKGVIVTGTTAKEFRTLLDKEYAAMGEVMQSIGLSNK